MNTPTFKDFEASAGGRRAAGYLAKHKTDMREMYGLILRTVTHNITRLTPGKRYKAAQLCGPDLWETWGFKGQKCAAGMCFFFLVNVGALPLTLHKTKSGKGSKRYLVPIQEVRVATTT